MNDPMDYAKTQMNQMDEAELRVFYKAFLKNYGRIQLLQAVDTMQRCSAIALEVIRDNW